MRVAVVNSTIRVTLLSDLNELNSYHVIEISVLILHKPSFYGNLFTYNHIRNVIGASFTHTLSSTQVFPNTIQHTNCILPLQ